MLSKFLNGYEEYMREYKESSEDTLKSYIGDIKNYNLFLISESINRLEETSKTSIIQYLMDLQNQGRATSTIARNVSSLRSFHQYLLNKSFIQEDPTINLKAPRVEKKVPEVLTVSEVEKILDQPDIDSFKGLRDRAMLELLYSTGIGINELVELNVNDLNLKLEIINIESENSRTVPLGSIAINYLQMYLDKYQDLFKTEALFVNRSMERISRQGFWKNLKEYEKSSGLDKNITPQIFRQSFAVHMLDNGADLKTVQKILGHSDISTTQIYALKVESRNLREVYKENHPRA